MERKLTTTINLNESQLDWLQARRESNSKLVRRALDRFMETEE